MGYMISYAAIRTDIGIRILPYVQRTCLHGSPLRASHTQRLCCAWKEKLRIFATRGGCGGRNKQIFESAVVVKKQNQTPKSNKFMSNFGDVCAFHYPPPRDRYANPAKRRLITTMVTHRTMIRQIALTIGISWCLQTSICILYSSQLPRIALLPDELLFTIH